MTPELLSLTKAVQTLAEAVTTLAGNMGHEQMERKAKLVASDLADAIVDWEEDATHTNYNTGEPCFCDLRFDGSSGPCVDEEPVVGGTDSTNGTT